MTRKCSHCSHNGHNSRTCPNRGVRLFGVRLTDGSIRKSASMGNLSLPAGSSGGASPADLPEQGSTGWGDGAEPDAAAGYVSDDLVQGSSSSCRDRKRGVPWTEEEHRRFLLGLQKLGKGDWRGISRNYVVSRTPTQVASHAQKYFIRQTNVSRRKRRSSLFDMVPNEITELPPLPSNRSEETPENGNDKSATIALMDKEAESMDLSRSVRDFVASDPRTMQCSCPAYLPPVLQSSVSSRWGPEQGTYKPIKPVAVHSRTAIHITNFVGMAKLSIAESNHEPTSLSLSLGLLGGSDRQSAFHSNSSTKAEA